MSLKDQIRQKLALGKIIKFTVLAQPKKLLMLNGIKTIQIIWQRLQQSFRLMVGVPDYQTYLEHMKIRDDIYENIPKFFIVIERLTSKRCRWLFYIGLLL